MNSVTTNYTLDRNAGLTQVLADGSDTYLYGAMHLGELQPGGWAYHLGDALGSVRVDLFECERQRDAGERV